MQYQPPQPDYTNLQVYVPSQQLPSPGLPPQRPQEPRRFNTMLYIALLCAILLAMFISGLVGYYVGKDRSPQIAVQQIAPTDQPTVQPTSQPTQQKWVTTHTFSGNGAKKTAVFSVPGDWKLLWSCQGLTDGSGVDGVLYVYVYNSDGTSFDINAVGATCKYGKVTKDETEEHQSGSVYLETNTGLPWTIQIQELK